MFQYAESSPGSESLQEKPNTHKLLMKNMLIDAHCHPFDLAAVLPGFEDERRRFNVLCAASAADCEEFVFNEELARNARAAGAARLLPCFAVHPQLPAGNSGYDINANLELLENLAEQGRLAAVGEAGFDLYNAQFRETEALQDRIFAFHADVALRRDLPLVLHMRRAMHKIFSLSGTLKKCRALVFHSWSGTLGEAQSLLARGINAYFSFGTVILLNHREAMRSCASLPADRLLTETDAPYQPLRNQGRNFSSWADLPEILNAAAALRREAGAHSKTGAAGADAAELEQCVEKNFREAFGL